MRTRLRKINVYVVGDWVWVYSPINGDHNKRTGKGQEIRLGFIYKINEKKTKYYIQMFSNKDNQQTNWTFTRENGQKISARNYYHVTVNQIAIIHKEKKYQPLKSQEITELRKLINQAKKKKVSLTQEAKLLNGSQRNQINNEKNRKR